MVEQSKWNRDGRQWWISRSGKVIKEHSKRNSDSSTIMMEQLKWNTDGGTPKVEQR